MEQVLRVMSLCVWEDVHLTLIHHNFNVFLPITSIYTSIFY